MVRYKLKTVRKKPVFLTLKKVIVNSERCKDPKKAFLSVLLSLSWNLSRHRTCSLPFPEIHTQYFMYLLSQTYLPPMGLATQKGRKLRAQQRLRKQAKPVYLQSHDETWHTHTHTHTHTRTHTHTHTHTHTRATVPILVFRSTREHITWRNRS